MTPEHSSNIYIICGIQTPDKLPPCILMPYTQRRLYDQLCREFDKEMFAMFSKRLVSEIHHSEPYQVSVYGQGTVISHIIKLSERFPVKRLQIIYGEAARLASASEAMVLPSLPEGSGDSFLA